MHCNQSISSFSKRDQTEMHIITNSDYTRLNALKIFSFYTWCTCQFMSYSFLHSFFPSSLCRIQTHFLSPLLGIQPETANTLITADGVQKCIIFIYYLVKLGDGRRHQHIHFESSSWSALMPWHYIKTVRGYSSSIKIIFLFAVFVLSFQNIAKLLTFEINLRA